MRRSQRRALRAAAHARKASNAPALTTLAQWCPYPGQYLVVTPTTKEYAEYEATRPGYSYGPPGKVRVQCRDCGERLWIGDELSALRHLWRCARRAGPGP
jgi:hypothetical protein